MSQREVLPDISIVLVKTSHPGNVGAVARAMKTMGLSDLRLVQPRHAAVQTDEEAVAFASGAQDVLAQLKVFEDLPSALADRQLAFALSARLREMGPTLQTPAQASNEALLEMQHGLNVAFVFGAERTGLSNEELLLCNRQIYIPGNPNYNSLNLAQAVQIMSYAIRQAWLDTESMDPLQVPNPEKKGVKSVDLASVQAVAALRDHWLQAMTRVDFLNPNKPKKLIERLTRLLARVPLEREEVDMLRGFLSDVIRVADGRLYPHERVAGQIHTEANSPSGQLGYTPSSNPGESK